MEFNSYFIIVIVLAAVIIYHLYNEKNKYEQMANDHSSTLKKYIAKDHETFIDELTEKLSKEKIVKENIVKEKIDKEDNLYKKYGVDK